ncbi:MAG: class I SAM-dependent methyltransferase [Phycisphaerae bacterium]
MIPSDPMTRNTDQDWIELGEHDPYFGVLTADDYRGEQLPAETLERFFATGRRHVDKLWRLLDQRMALDPRPGRALDFGCGVGRVTFALAERCGKVVGADVSPAMLQRARDHAARLEVPNVTFARSDDSLVGIDGRFDLVHSYIVFQHIPPARGLPIVSQLLGRLNPGGLAALHFTHSWSASAVRRGINWLQKNVPLVHGMANAVRQRPIKSPMVAMYHYPVGDLLNVFAAAGCEVLTKEPTDHGGHLGSMLLLSRTGDGHVSPTEGTYLTTEA